MLPIVATMVMGGLAKQNAGAQSMGAGASAGAGGGLMSMLDQNNDGSVADDVMGMLGKFLGGR
jgi:hypothetical protein